MEAIWASAAIQPDFMLRLLAEIRYACIQSALSMESGDREVMGKRVNHSFLAKAMIAS